MVDLDLPPSMILFSFSLYRSLLSFHCCLIVIWKLYSCTIITIFQLVQFTPQRLLSSYKFINTKTLLNLCFYAVEQFNFLDWTASFLLEGKSDQNFVVLHLLSPPSPFGNGPSPLIHLLYPRQIGAKAGRRL